MCPCKCVRACVMLRPGLYREVGGLVAEVLHVWWSTLWGGCGAGLCREVVL